MMIRVMIKSQETVLAGSHEKSSGGFTFSHRWRTTDVHIVKMLNETIADKLDEENALQNESLN